MKDKIVEMVANELELWVDGEGCKAHIQSSH